MTEHQSMDNHKPTLSEIKQFVEENAKISGDEVIKR